MQTSFKEARETNLWLRLIADSKLIGQSDELESLIQESAELSKILAQIVKSSKNNFSFLIFHFLLKRSDRWNLSAIQTRPL